MREEEPYTFGDALRRHRKAAGLTQEELAERAGIAPETISALERGVNRAPHRDTVRALTEALELTWEARAALRAAARRLSVPLAEGTTADEHQTLAAQAEPQRWAIGGYLGALPETPLVARDAERTQLFAAVEAVARGDGGRLVLLAGEPGIGKTRLAQEVTLVARDRGYLVLTGRCYEPQRVVAYFPFLEALTTAYAVAPASMRQELPQRWPEVARLLPDTPADAQTSHEASSGGRDDQQRLFYQLTGFLRTLAGAQPLAVLLDDLHWADGASLDLLQHLARHTCGYPILLLGTYRDMEVNRQHPFERALRDLTREHLFERLILDRLPIEGTRALLAVFLGEPDVSEEFATLLHARTEGNPFFTQEVVRALVERGDVFQAESGWDRKAIAEIAVPESVRSVIGQRLAHLSEESQEVLREASILGQRFAFADLAAMHGCAEEMVETALEEAVGAGLVYEADGDAYGFRHALIQQTLYAELPARKRRRLHHAIAEVIEALAESARQRRIAELAYHFLQAGERGRALPSCLRAGDQAEAVYAHAEAERHYRTALELARELGDQAHEAEALEKLGEALLHLARSSEALAMIEAALAT